MRWKNPLRWVDDRLQRLPARQRRWLHFGWFTGLALYDEVWALTVFAAGVLGIATITVGSAVLGIDTGLLARVIYLVLMWLVMLPPLLAVIALSIRQRDLDAKIKVELARHASTPEGEAYALLASERERSRRLSRTFLLQLLLPGAVGSIGMGMGLGVLPGPFS